MNRLWSTPSSQRIPLEPRFSRKRLHNSIPMTAGNDFRRSLCRATPFPLRPTFSPDTFLRKFSSATILYHLIYSPVKFSGCFHPLSAYFQQIFGTFSTFTTEFLSFPTTFQKNGPILRLSVLSPCGAKKRRGQNPARISSIKTNILYFRYKTSSFNSRPSAHKFRRHFSSFAPKNPKGFHREFPPPFPP